MTRTAARPTTDVYELLSRLSATKGLNQMLDEVLSASLHLMQVDMGYIALYSPGTKIVTQRGLDELLEYFLRHAPVPSRELPPGQALATGKRVFVPDVYSFEALRPHLHVIERAGYVSMQVTPLITRGGEPVGTISTYSRSYRVPPEEAFETLDLYALLAADLIEREQTREALSVSEERLRLATTSAGIVPWKVNFKTNRVWYGGGEQQFESSESLPTLDEVLMLIHPLDRHRALRAVLDAKEQAGPFTLEFRGIPRDGAVRCYQATGRVMRDTEGQPEHLVGINQDTTERKRAQTELQENEERFRRLYDLTLRISRTEGLQDALNEILDSALQLLDADGGRLRLVGDDVDAPVPFGASKDVPGEYLDYVRSLSREELARSLGHEAIANREPAIAEDVFSHPATRQHAEAMRDAGIASILCWPLVTNADKVLGVLTAYFGRRHTPSPEQLQMLELYGKLAVDTVEREGQLARQREAEAALRGALSLRNEFLGLVSHELRTPMTVVRGLASILDRKELPKEELAAVYGDLRDESERLYWLIENMLRLARLEAGQRPETDDLMLRRTLKAIVGRLERNVRSLDVRIELPPSDTIVSAIETYLEQILQNLLQNAAKYSERGTPVDISTVVGQETVQIRVADRGIGVSDTESVFQPFQREEDADKRASGLGLGLAVCKALVEAQGGRIWVERRAGGGSEFCFTLPRVRVDSPGQN